MVTVGGVFDHLDGATRLYPIIGDPIEYVESPVRLTRTFAARGHNGVCVPIRVPAGKLREVIDGLSAMLNVDGILVTMPHKFDASKYCATKSQRTRLLGVVSVMRRNEDLTWHGDMLDGLAFLKAQRDQGAKIENGVRYCSAREVRAARLRSRCSMQAYANSSSTIETALESRPCLTC